MGELLLCVYCGFSSHRHHCTKSTHTHTPHTGCQTVDSQSAYPLPPLISEPSLRNTAPTWNSLAPLSGLPSGTVLCVFVGEENCTQCTAEGICMHRFPISLKRISVTTFLCFLCPVMLSWSRNKKCGWKAALCVAPDFFIFLKSLSVEWGWDLFTSLLCVFCQSCKRAKLRKNKWRSKSDLVENLEKECLLFDFHWT